MSPQLYPQEYVEAAMARHHNLNQDRRDISESPTFSFRSHWLELVPKAIHWKVQYMRERGTWSDGESVFSVQKISSIQNEEVKLSLQMQRPLSASYIATE